MVEPVHGRVFGDGAAHLIAPRRVGRELLEKRKGLFEGRGSLGVSGRPRGAAPVLGAAVAEVDELLRFQAFDDRGFDTVGFNG
jgi:hypothetical protein